VSAIRCEGLSRRYGDVLALDSLSLTVETGSVFGFLGRNGAGKTTTIRLLTGLARPTSGNAWIDGASTTLGSGALLGNFGYLPEEPAFYTWMTPREYLNYVGQLFSLDSNQRSRRTEELLDRTGLLAAGDRRIGGFSKGMRQRLGLAQALINGPPVLFLDEPTSALDPAGRRDVLDLIDALRGKTTVFLSSHILGDVERVCDTIGVIHEGRLVRLAGREQLLSEHAQNAVVLEFEQASASAFEPFVARLSEEPWVLGHHEEEGSLRIYVGDADTGKKALLPLVLEHGLTLNRYEWVRPTLEEVFLSISVQ
jgi:ABC-2 type transport system ATP-binding protein